MAHWAYVPLEFLTQMYLYLPRRDRLSCSLVCQNWKDALNQVTLWKTLVVYLDIDLMEPSTILLIRDYSQYIKHLECGWAVPHRTQKWLPQRHKQVIKRAVRLFLIMYDKYIQITKLRIFNWFDFGSFRKIVYHLSRFLGIQLNLEVLVFDNINIQSPFYMQILRSCLKSKSIIKHLDIQTCYYCQSTFEFVYFQTCIEQLSQLHTLILDYYIMSCDLVEAILVSQNSSLRLLQLVLKDNWHNKIIDEPQWYSLQAACPKLQVTLIIRNIYYHDELKLYFKKSIPLTSISLALPRLLQPGIPSNIKKTINMIVNYYRNSLEILDLHFINEFENLDDTILMVIVRCRQLKSLIFNGIVENPKTFIDFFETKHIEKVSLCVFYARENVKLSGSKITKAICEFKQHKRMQFNFVKVKKDHIICSMLILN